MKKLNWGKELDKAQAQSDTAYSLAPPDSETQLEQNLEYSNIVKAALIKLQNKFLKEKVIRLGFETKHCHRSQTSSGPGESYMACC